MDMRNEWTIGDNEGFSDMFYNREESIQSVKDNFDLRRYYTSEGYDIEINGITERCLVQTSSNPLRELNDFRKIHCPITADVKRGYYVKYEGTFWIIDTNVADIDGAYLSARMSRCQYLLRWQNSTGNIIERWSYSSDQTKYSNGETGNNIITVGDNQYCLLLPIDEETKLLRRGMRFAVDFEDSDEPDVYALTNRKVNLNNEVYFDRGGTMTITLSFDALNRDKDKQVVLEDGRKAWICDYIPPSTTLPPSDEITDSSVIIAGNTKLKVGFSRTYTANLSDNYGNIIEWDDTLYKWKVVSDFVINQSATGNKIKLFVDDESLIGSSFLLQIINIENNVVISGIEITICDVV